MSQAHPLTPDLSQYFAIQQYSRGKLSLNFLQEKKSILF